VSGEEFTKGQVIALLLLLPVLSSLVPIPSELLSLSAPLPSILAALVANVAVALDNRSLDFPSNAVAHAVEVVDAKSSCICTLLAPKKPWTRVRVPPMGLVRKKVYPHFKLVMIGLPPMNQLLQARSPTWVVMRATRLPWPGDASTKDVDVSTHRVQPQHRTTARPVVESATKKLALSRLQLPCQHKDECSETLQTHVMEMHRVSQHATLCLKFVLMAEDVPECSELVIRAVLYSLNVGDDWRPRDTTLKNCVLPLVKKYMELVSLQHFRIVNFGNPFAYLATSMLTNIIVNARLTSSANFSTS
jgi:hypothetical protein